MDAGVKILVIEEGSLTHWIARTIRAHVTEGARIYNPAKRIDYLSQLKDKTIRHQIERLYVLLDAALQMQDLALKEASALGRRYPEIEQFMRVPGVGPIGALIFDAYIQTPHHFTCKSPLWRYCQLGVSDRTSDGKPLGYKRLDRPATVS